MTTSYPHETLYNCESSPDCWNIEKLNYIHFALKTRQLFPEYVTDKKDDVTALLKIKEGNKLFSQDRTKTLDNYTGALALAKSENVVFQAYAKRSSCLLYNFEKPKQCIEDIERALARQYTEEATYKDTLIRRLEVAQHIEEPVEHYHEPIPEIPDDRKNFRIQCASDCVKIEERDGVTCIVANRNIEIGEVISVERPYACIPDKGKKFRNCHHCLEMCYNPIPCESCTEVMYCSQNCKKTAGDSYHRFECPIVLTLSSLLIEFSPVWLAIRVALLATIEVCGGPFFCNGYHKIKTVTRPLTFQKACITAFIFELVQTKTDFFTYVSSISLDTLTHKDIEDKFKELLLDQVLAKTDIVKIYESIQDSESIKTENIGFGWYPFFSQFNHSCCANVMKLYYGNTMVLRALNNIKQGDELYVNRYGVRYDVYPLTYRQQIMLKNNGIPRCRCRACQYNLIPCNGNMSEICRSLKIRRMEFGDIVKNVIGSDTETANRYLPVLIRLLKKYEFAEFSGNAVILKNLLAHCYVIFGNMRVL